MKYRQLRYILKIAEEKNISLAAKKLYISQPSLSQLLLNVEKMIGAPIFDRSSMPLKPTYIGEMYIKTARQILDLSEQFYQQVDDVIHLNRGHVTIGCSPFRSTYLLARFIPYFQKNCPDITLELREDTTLQLEALAKNGETDISISLLPIDKKSFSYETLFKEKLLLAIPPYHPICRKYNSSPGIFSKPPIIDLIELKNSSFILMDHGQKLHHTLLELCRKAGFSPKIQLETRSMDAAQALAGAGIGITLLPHTLIQSMQPKLAPCYFSLVENPYRTVIVIWRRDRYLSHAAKEFIRLLKKFCVQITKKPFS